MGLLAVIYFAGDWPLEFYWGQYGLHFPNFYCPACGGATALYNLARGNLALAWQYNQLFVLGLPFIVYGGLIVLRAVATGKLNKSVLFHPVFLWASLGVILLFAILRNIPLDAFACLRPPS